MATTKINFQFFHDKFISLDLEKLLVPLYVTGIVPSKFSRSFRVPSLNTETITDFYSFLFNMKHMSIIHWRLTVIHASKVNTRKFDSLHSKEVWKTLNIST